jgi:hypothetical protein
MGYQIAFWVVFSLILSILSIFIWLCIQKNKDDRIMEISSIGLQYLIKNYLIKCFQKVCVLLIKSKNQIISQKLKSEDITDQQDKFIKMFVNPLSIKIINFTRGQEIVKNINNNVSQYQFEKLDLFIFPDQLIIDNDYYKYLLLYTSEKTLIHPLEKTNQDAKIYLAQLMENTSESIK